MGRLFWIILGGPDIITGILRKGMQKSESDRRGGSSAEGQERH